jgi:hypothetical protein
MPIASQQSYLGLAKESTRGTVVAPSIWLPVRSPAPFDNITYLEDKGLRGSMVDHYGVIQGVIYQDYQFAGDFIPDTAPNIVSGVLGSATVTASSAIFVDGSMTNASAVLTSNTAQFVAADVGKTITVSGAGAAGGLLSSTISSIGTIATGAIGSTTATLAATASTTVASGATITITRTGVSNNTHVIGLLNNSGATGNQPSSYTAVDVNGYTATARQIAAMQFSDLSTKFDATAGLFEFTAKAVGNPSTAVANPSSSFTTVAPVAAWTGGVQIAGALNAKVESGDLQITRGVTPQFTVQASQAPYRLFAGPVMAQGRFTFIYEDDSDLVRYLNNSQPAVVINFTQPTTQSSMQFRMSQCAMRVAKVLRSKDYVEVEVQFKGIPNTTDATAGGYSPVVARIVNGQSTAY